MNIRNRTFRIVALILGASFVAVGSLTITAEGFKALGVIGMGLYFLFYAVTGYARVSHYMRRNERNKLI